MTTALFVLTASTLPFGCFKVTARTVRLGWAAPLLGGAQESAKLVLKQYMYTHHKENQQQRGKIHTTNKYS